MLEVGCGIGTAAVNFARCGADYTGVELSEASLKLTRQRFDVYGLEGRFVLCNAEQLSQHVESNFYDLVYSFGVIHHSPNQRAIIEEVRKVIRNDGEFRCMLYAKNSWKDIMIEAGFDQPEAQRGCPYATTYTIEMLHDLYRGLFEVVSADKRTFSRMSSRSTSTTNMSYSPGSRRCRRRCSPRSSDGSGGTC